MHRSLVILFTASLGLAGCGDGSESAPTARATSSAPTTVALPTTTTPLPSATVGTTGPRSDDEAVAAFVEAWRNRDVDAMRTVAEAPAVEMALRFESPTGPAKCSAQASGQYQCIVEVAGEAGCTYWSASPAPSKDECGGSPSTRLGAERNVFARIPTGAPVPASRC